mmetsp:Transcript_17222/g.28307  ORF Transcript_17222/g.28307 Transcript_17222/m.28307 type:complete len:551 (+) Transcript_17222:192-1844(+)
MEAASLSRLRNLCRDYCAKHMHDSAMFLADKLVTMSGGAADDIYMLADVYFLTKQYRRAFHCLKRRKLHTSSLRFKLLAAQCQAELKQWDECLAILGDSSEDDESPETNFRPVRSPDFNRMSVGSYVDGASPVMMIIEETTSEDSASHSVNLQAALCLLRGRVYDALENRSRATHWYSEAVRKDPFCFEAFERLIDSHMLTISEERELVSSLKITADDHWLKDLYLCKLKKYDTAAGDSILQTLSALEQTADLKGNVDVAVCKADTYYYRGDYQRCLDITSSVLVQNDSYDTTCLPLHIVCLVELKRKNDLFLCAHRLVEEHGDSAVAWYAVGCFYLLVGKYETARRYFSKATSLDQRFVPAWIGFGNAFAAQDETDQAMAAYRTASRLFPGLHLPLLYIGMEYLRTNNINISHQFFQQAKQICPFDPLVYNELGVVAYVNGEFVEACKFLKEALSLISGVESTELILINLGHTYRRLGDFKTAISYFEKALSVNSRNATTYSALGYSLHLMGQVDGAIEYYHKALSLKPDDTFTNDILQRALDEEFGIG